MRARVVTAAALCLLVLGAGCNKKKSFRVAAAADLQLAFQEVATAFKAQGGATPSFTFGSSGLLAKQVAEGAPFDLFASGNTGYVDQVVAAGACDAATKSAYARGRLVAWTPPGGPAPPTTLADLADPRFKRIAMANPEHAPYGKAAKQALTSVGILAAVQSRLIPGENVRAALRYAETGDVDVALVSMSLTINKKDGTSLAIDGALHEPLDQAMVVCKHGKRGEDALAFASFVASAPGRAIMRRYGFLLPGEAISAKP